MKKWLLGKFRKWRRRRAGRQDLVRWAATYALQLGVSTRGWSDDDLIAWGLSIWDQAQKGIRFEYPDKGYGVLYPPNGPVVIYDLTPDEIRGKFH